MGTATPKIRRGRGHLQLGDHLPFGDFSPQRYAWFLSDRRAIAKPFPVWGKLGLFEVEIPEGLI